MVMEGLHDDMGDSSMLCTNHPYSNNTPGGICAFCLQEKLGKLVSSSFPITVFPSHSLSSSPSTRSEFGTSVTNSNKTTASSYTSYNNNSTQVNNEDQYRQYYARRSKIMFLLSQKKKKKDLNMMATSEHNSIMFKRSKSTTTPRRGMHFMDADSGDDLRTQRRRFWSFLHMPKPSSNQKTIRDISSNSMAVTTIGSTYQRDQETETQDNDTLSFDRKVSRSRSVGCGSRSFSGDFFERISTGFGDCALRRVESQREGKSKIAAAVRGAAGGHDSIKERVKCGGIFSGFMVASSSSSSSSSSYWLSSSTEDNATTFAGKLTPAPPSSRQLVHSRSKSWGWALASPMRAFSKPTGKRVTSNKNATPNLSAIPSLLTIRT